MKARGPPSAPPGSGATSHIEVDAGALQANIEALRSRLAPARMVLVAKANAYGHGVAAVVPAAEAGGIEDFAVFSTQEAFDVAQHAGAKSTIQVMGHARAEEVPALAARGIEVWANDEGDTDNLIANPGPRPLGVHVEVETGMHRTGMHPDAAVEAALRIADAASTRLVGLCTHLAGAEDPRNDTRIEAQLKVFDDVRRRLADVGVQPLCHVASSSAALRWPDRRYDMVRCGIAAYGLWPTPAVEAEARKAGRHVVLRPALSWHSSIMAVKDIPAGSCVGYGESFCTAEPIRVGIVPVGYGDGFTRQLSMNGHVLVREQRCPIVGQVNMNMVMVLLPDAAMGPGDRVTLVGEQGAHRIGVHSFSEWNEVINYEFMARLGRHVPRIVTGAEGA